MPPATFEASLDDRLVGTLDDAAAERIAACPESCVADLVQPPLEILAGDPDSIGSTILQPCQGCDDMSRVA